MRAPRARLAQLSPRDRRHPRPRHSSGRRARYGRDLAADEGGRHDSDRPRRRTRTPSTRRSPARSSGASSSCTCARSSTTSNSKLQHRAAARGRLCRTISADKLTYTIKVRTGIKFNDGTRSDPSRSQAVARATPHPQGVHARQRDLTRSARSTSSGDSVVLHLEATVLAVDGAARRPRRDDHVAEGSSPTLGDTFGTNPVCVGAVHVQGARLPATTSRSSKSPYYYDKAKVHLDTIVFRIIDRPRARAPQSLRAQRHPGRRPRPVDRCCRSLAEATPGVTVIKTPTIGYQGFTLNIGNKNGLLKPYSNVGTAARQFTVPAAGL